MLVPRGAFTQADFDRYIWEDEMKRSGGCIKPVSESEVVANELLRQNEERNKLIERLANFAYAVLQEKFVSMDHAIKRDASLGNFRDAYEDSIAREAYANAAISVRARLLSEFIYLCPHGKRYGDLCKECEADDAEPLVQGPDTQL